MQGKVRIRTTMCLIYDMFGPPPLGVCGLRSRPGKDTYIIAPMSTVGLPTAVQNALHLLQSLGVARSPSVLHHTGEGVDGDVQEAGQAQVQGPAALLPVALPRLQPRRRPRAGSATGGRMC